MRGNFLHMRYLLEYFFKMRKNTVRGVCKTKCVKKKRSKVCLIPARSLLMSGRRET